MELKAMLKQVDGKEYVHLYVVFKDKYKEKCFAVVPLQSISNKAKLYFYDQVKKRLKTQPSLTIKGNASGAQ